MITATATYEASETPGTVTIQASAAGGGTATSATVDITLIEAVAAITLAATPNELLANGKSESTITAMVTDGNGNPVQDNERINFSILSPGTGGLPYSTSNRDYTVAGMATATYRSSTAPGTVTIQASAAGGGTATSATVDITLIDAGLGSISLTATPDTIPADGLSSSAITASLKDSSGGAIAVGTSVTFTTFLGTFTNGSTSYTVTTPDDSGTVVVSLIAGTTPGNASVAATSGGISQSVTVEFTGGGVPPAPSTLSLSLSETSVKSDNSDSSTITATVLDNNNAVIEGIPVAFTSNGGQLSSSIVGTDANGEAQVTFSSGTVEKKNQTVTIEAAVSGLAPKQIPIQITGTGITLSTATTILEIGGNNTTTLTITVKDAGQTGIYDANVAVSVDPASTGAATLSLSTDYTDYTTDVNGILEVDVTGTGAGSVTVNVSALGATAAQTYTVDITDAVFGISAPADDPQSLSTNTNLTITVNAPSQENVQFATTIGAWDGGANMVVTKAVVAGQASAVLRSSEAGVAIVQVFDADDPSTTDSLKVAISAPNSEASQIALQASATVVAPSTGGISNTVTLTATVKNVSDQPVGSAPVAFSIENPTGGGETISPVIVYTDSSGEASSTFTSGSLSSDAQGVTVKASVVGTAIEDTTAIVIGGTAGSVMIGQGTTITSINDDTAYRLPMSVMVSDSNGNPMSGANVTLSLWPSQYRTGVWVEADGECEPGVTGTFINEDANRNLILDPGEDTGPGGAPDGQLTPPSSAAGSAPATVTADENGVANFNGQHLGAWNRDPVNLHVLVTLVRR